MNKKLILGTLVFLVVVMAGVFYFLKNYHLKPAPTPIIQLIDERSVKNNPQVNGQNNVVIQNFSFSPQIIMVKVGDKVTWTNQDSMGHSVTADDKSFDTEVFGNGESKSLTFAKAGSFAYHCSVHPSMMGTVVVQ